MGEIFLCGAGMSRGYVNQAEKTMESFMRNPFPQLAEVFRDLGYVRENGEERREKREEATCMECEFVYSVD